MSYGLAIIIAYLEVTFLSARPIPLIIWSTVYFLLIYLTFASLAWCVAKLVNRPIEKRKPKPQQIQTEIVNSLSSILIFGTGMLIPWWMFYFNLTSFANTISILSITAECLVLIIWNDVHFYAVHRLLHSKLKKSHVMHHLSIATTPFSAYSMGNLEALLLGSVMPIAMLFYHFSLVSLVFLTIWSIAINTLAHSNCDLFPNASERSLLSLVKHHQNHHSNYHGNYSFFFTQLDHWFNTAQPIKKTGFS